MQIFHPFSYHAVVPHRCMLGEGPIWDPANQTICWIDIHKGIICEYLELEKRYHTITLGEMVGAITLTNSGDFIAALKSGLALVNRQTGTITKLINPESHLPANRFNDGKCDAAGRFWVGTMAIDETRGAGSLYMFKKDLHNINKIPGVSISNGMAWSLDNKRFYYIDTPTFQVVVYDYEIGTGEISNKRVAIQIPESEGFPDGMSIDDEGMLWIAHWDGWQVTKWDPESGEKLQSISLPVARITSCTFGGENLSDLYITTACTGLTKEQYKKQPLAGCLLVIKNCGSRGLPANLFDYQKK
jgi:sugar lactone lactonase YvrE